MKLENDNASHSSEPKRFPWSKNIISMILRREWTFDEYIAVSFVGLG